MAMDDNALLRPRPKSTLLEMVSTTARGPEAEPESSALPQRSDPLPRPGDAYVAHARRMPHPQMTLFFVGKDFLPNGFSYASLERVWLADGDKPGDAPVLIVRFSGSVVTEAVIEGRQLHTLCYDIGQHLLPWLWQHPSPKDFADDKEPLIRKITFRQVEN